MSLLAELDTLLEEKKTGTLRSLPIFKRKYDAFWALTEPEANKMFDTSTENTKLIVRKMYHVLGFGTPSINEMFIMDEPSSSTTVMNSFKTFLMSKHEHGLTMFRSWADGGSANAIEQMFRRGAKRSLTSGLTMWYNARSGIGIVKVHGDIVWFYRA